MISRWTTMWSDPLSGLQVQHQPADGYIRQRVVSNGLRNGAVVAALDESRVLFISIDRPIVGQRLIELPRGMADLEDINSCETGRRELLEETGYAAESIEMVGTIWPDSGLLGDGVDVVVARDLTLVGADSAEFRDLRWLDATEIDVGSASGLIRDGITLASITLLRASGKI